MYGLWTHLLLRRREARQGSFGFGKTNAFKAQTSRRLVLGDRGCFHDRERRVGRGPARRNQRNQCRGRLGVYRKKRSWWHRAHGHDPCGRGQYLVSPCVQCRRPTDHLTAASRAISFPAEGLIAGVSIEGKSIQNNQIFVDPRPMRHIMLPLLQDDQLVVSISERDGTTHDYTFSLQPNDVALRAIRSRCFGF
jgi:hypothetical protein